jgi:hypothetical protein
VKPMRVGQQRDGLIDLCNVVEKLLGDRLYIIEIGAYAGHGTEIISNIFPNSRIHSVDMWAPYEESCSSYDRAKQGAELREAELEFDIRTESRSNVTKVKMSSVEYADILISPYDMVEWVYIDGNHDTDYFMADLTVWLPKIKRGGIISGHDGHWPSVRTGLTIVMEKGPDQTFCDGSWLYNL